MTEKIIDNLPIPNDFSFNWKSRKLWVAIILFVFATLVFGLPIIPVTFLEWSGFIKWVFGIYLITNAASKGVFEESSNWKSRKLWGLIVILSTTTIFLFTGTVVFGEWTVMTQWCYGIYSGSNVISKYMDNLNL